MRWVAVVVALVLMFPARAAIAAGPPPNDTFSAATPISGQHGESESSNAGATKEAGEPAHAGNAGGGSVWFRWTAPRSGHYAFETAGSDFDTLLAVYTGSALEALDELAGDDDSGPGARSELSLRAVAGTVYHVALDGFEGKVGRVQLAWRRAPPNDNFADAQTVQGASGRTEIPDAGATKEVGEPDHAGTFADQSVWYRWTAPGDMRVGFNVRGLASALSVYTGANLNSLESVADGPWAVFAAGTGTTYQIAVERPDADAVLRWRFPPPNDDFRHAATITGPSGRARGTNLAAGREAAEPRHGRGAGASIWYWWQAPRDGVLRMRTAGSTFDTLLAVYKGTRLRALDRLATDDDSGPGTTSRIRIDVRRESIYRIAVDGYRAAMGDVVLRWSLSPPLPS
jgi:hypothetical protein